MECVCNPKLCESYIRLQTLFPVDMFPFHVTIALHVSGINRTETQHFTAGKVRAEVCLVKGLFHFNSIE